MRASLGEKTPIINPRIPYPSLLLPILHAFVCIHNFQSTPNLAQRLKVCMFDVGEQGLPIMMIEPRPNLGKILTDGEQSASHHQFL